MSSSARIAAFLVATIGLGCVGHERFAGAEGEPLYTEPPSISAIRWDCSSGDATWAFEVDTVHWTANGSLWLAQGADYVEKHAVRSVSAAHDGTWDELALELDIVADWREASSGSSTAFFCNDTTLEAISFRLVVYTPGSEDEADCRSWGADPELFDGVSGVASCELLWEDPDTGTER
jgi:hypothetical protein